MIVHREKEAIFHKFPRIIGKLRSEDPSLLINRATKEVANQRPYKSQKFVNTRYYRFRKKSNNMPPDEVVKEFGLSADLL